WGDQSGADSLWHAENDGNEDAEDDEDDGNEDDDGDVDAAPADAGSLPVVPDASGERTTLPANSGGLGPLDADDGSGATPGPDVDVDVDMDVDDSGDAGGTHGMTMAITYNAARRFANPAEVAVDAKGWVDWLGIVGDVPAYTINAFLRESGVDSDFFNGTDDPDERLAKIDEHSSFYAERMVVVGVEGEDEWIAEEAAWEFIPLAEAAGEADWALQDPED
ncbi:MAG: hypothetical protein V5A23_09010, partial [Halobacteriales archaeon]